MRKGIDLVAVDGAVHAGVAIRSLVVIDPVLMDVVGVEVSAEVVSTEVANSAVEIVDLVSSEEVAETEAPEVVREDHTLSISPEAVAM